jgi:hypothetical protein
MALLTIIVLFLVFKALREKHPLKLILTEAEAKAIRARWWAAAKGELSAWAVCFVLGGALLGEDLVEAHWKPFTYVAIVWVSLLLFSRLAIWITLAAAVLAYLGNAIGIHFYSSVTPFAMGAAGIYAMAIRAVLFLFSASKPCRHVYQPRPPRRPVYDLENRNP